MPKGRAEMRNWKSWVNRRQNTPVFGFHTEVKILGEDFTISTIHKGKPWRGNNVKDRTMDQHTARANHIGKSRCVQIFLAEVLDHPIDHHACGIEFRTT